MGSHNLKKCQNFFIHALQFPLKCFTYVCMGKPYVCNILCPHATLVGTVERTQHHYGMAIHKYVLSVSDVLWLENCFMEIRICKLMFSISMISIFHNQASFKVKVICNTLALTFLGSNTRLALSLLCTLLMSNEPEWSLIVASPLIERR